MENLHPTPLWPISTLLSGALATFLAAKFLSLRLARSLASASATLAFFLTLSLALLPSHPFVLPPWGGLPGQPTLEARGEGLILAVLLTLFIALYAGLELVFSSEGRGEAILLLGAGTLAFLFSRDPLSLFLSWGFLDLAILLTFSLSYPGESSPHLPSRAALINLVGGVAWFSLFLSRQGFFGPSEEWGLCLLLAFWVRLALYPAHMALVASEEIPFPEGNLLTLAILGSGGYLLILGGWPQPEGWLRAVLLAWGAMALLYGALLPWRKQRLGLCLAQNQMGLLVLGLLAGGSWPAVSLQTVSLLLALGIFFFGKEVGPRLPSGYRLVAKGALAVAVASLLGLPPTGGFVARWLIYRSLWAEGGVMVLALGALTTVLITPPLLRTLVEPAQRPTLGQRGALTFSVLLSALAVLLLLTGIYPPFLRSLGGEEAVPGSLPLIGELLNQTPFPTSSALGVSLLLPPLLGYLLFRLKVQVRRGEPLFRFLELEWLYGTLERAGSWLGGILRGAMGWMEGAPSPGWLLLFALILVLFILRG